MQNLIELAKTGRLSRRDFLRQASAAGFAAGAATSIWSSKSFASTARKGGHVKLSIGAGETTDTLDPAIIENTTINVVLYALANTLVGLDSSSNLEPLLATSWDSNDDFTQWRLKLRDGVEFHDGRPMTQDDVIASLNHHRGEDTKSNAKSIASQIADIRKDGDDGIVIDLTSSNIDFIYLLADYHFLVFPSNDDGTIDWASGIGTGPFKLDSFDPGVRTYVTRNDRYWDPERPYFDSAEVLTVVDANARITALVSGSVDIVNGVDGKIADMVRNAPGLVVDSVVGSRSFHYAMRCDTAPFNDPDVRLAMKYAINREAFVDKILGGFGTVGNDHVLSPNNRFYDASIEQRAYDPDKAMHHLKKAGMEALGASLSVADSVYPGCVDGAVVYQEYAKAAGIDLEVVREPSDGYWSNVWMAKPMSASYWNGRPTADWAFTYTYSGESKWNDTFWQNERFNELLVAARSESDDAKRADMYSEMQRIMRDDNGAVVFAFANLVMARNEKVAHGDISGVQDLDGARILERWWFA